MKPCECTNKVTECHYADNCKIIRKIKGLTTKKGRKMTAFNEQFKENLKDKLIGN